jgi:stage II sporulation protein R
VIIESGNGKNWWCVVFPPLCMTAAEDFDEAAQAADLTPEEVKLITEDGGEYQFKFKIVEIFESIF